MYVQQKRGLQCHVYLFLSPTCVGHIIGEVAHDCVAALKNWFVDRGIKNSYDTWHGKLKEWMNPQWFVSLVTA